MGQSEYPSGGALDYGTTTEIADVAAAESAGVSAKVARADHVHSGAAYQALSDRDLLAVTFYDPGTLSIKDSTSTSLADVDATNLAITFTAPSTGKVLVVLTALVTNTSATAKTIWGLREGTTDLAGDGPVIETSGASAPQVRASHRIYITGLTPGNSYTYKWAHATTSGHTARMLVGGTITQGGPAVMEVHTVK